MGKKAGDGFGPKYGFRADLAIGERQVIECDRWIQHMVQQAAYSFARHRGWVVNTRVFDNSVAIERVA